MMPFSICLTCLFHFWEFGVLPGFHISGLLVVDVVLVVISVDMKLWSLSKEFITLLGVIKRSGATVTVFSVELDDFLLIRSDTMKLYRLKISKSINSSFALLKIVKISLCRKFFTLLASSMLISLIANFSNSFINVLFTIFSS